MEREKEGAWKEVGKKNKEGEKEGRQRERKRRER